jgi:hypothetical protein
MLIFIPLFLVDVFLEMSQKYFLLEYFISKETIYFLVSEVKGKAVLLVKTYLIKYKQ